MLHNKSYSLPGQLLNNEVLCSYITRFFKEVFLPLVEKGEIRNLMILCKIEYSVAGGESYSYKTLAALRRVEYNDLDLFMSYLCDRLGLIIDSYDPQIVSKIIFSYIIKDGKVLAEDRLLLKDINDKKLPFHEFNKLRLPVSMNPHDYGIIEVSNQIEEAGVIYHRYIVSSNNYTYRIDVFDKVNIVRILGKIDLTWTDYRISDDLTYFKREIGKSTLYFFDGEVVLQKLQLNAKSFRRLRKM
jgi:hypothetical protein